MKRLNLLKSDKLIALLHWLGWPVIVVYFVSMFVVPVARSGLKWDYIQDVWDRWQGLNIGMLALIASVIAFEIARYRENKQRGRDFLAARAFLPASFSELGAYFKASAAIYIDAWDEAEPRTRKIVRGAPPEAPQLPDSYRRVFADCIRHAEPEVGEVLAKMLSDLQVHDARLRELLREYRPIRHSLFAYLYSLGVLQTRMNKLYPFARGEEGFDSIPISWDEFHNAYKNLRIHVEDYELDLGEGVMRSLTDFTKRGIARMNGEEPLPYPGERAPAQSAA
jgi:hypothetical protein